MNILSRTRLFAALSFVLAGAGSAAPSPLYVPGLAHAPGRNGAYFESTLWIANLSQNAATAIVEFIPSSSPASAPAPVSIALGAGETREIDDPVTELFHLSNTFGTVAVTSESNLTVRATTSDVSDAAGTYGLDLQTFGLDSTILAGETVHIPWLSESRDRSIGFRTNIALTLLAPGTSATLTLFDETGFVRGVRTVESASPLSWQGSAADLAGDPDLAIGRVEVAVSNGEAIAYAAVVDNLTGDGILIPPSRPESFATDWLLDGVARSQGVNGSFWSSDVRLFNPGLVPLPVTISTNFADRPDLVIQRTVPPRGLVQLDDVLGPSGLSLGDRAAGVIRLSASTPFLAAARTANTAPGAPGSFGALIPTTVQSDSISEGQTAAFFGLTDRTASRGFRSNLALSASDGPAAGRLTLRSGPVPVTTVPFSLWNRQWTQQPLHVWFGREIPDNATVEIELDSGSLDAYVSVVDNGTGDPILLRPVVLPKNECVSVSITSFTLELTPGRFGSFTLHLEATVDPSLSAHVIPGDLPIEIGGSVEVTPSRPTTYHAVVTGGCRNEVSSALNIEPPLVAAEVYTTDGIANGVQSGDAIAWRGIPYAAPPVGPLRFRPPVSPDEWSIRHDATNFGPICPQLDSNGRYQGEESCLSLNLFAPADRNAGNLPVIVFLHGGANYEGASSLGVYDGSELASKFGAVVVTPNYRLGALGFLAHPSLDAESSHSVSGNYGLLDQIAALAWVKRNVPFFGGDPEKILLAGQSAGGYDACALLVSPLARGLFERILIESGGCANIPLADVEVFGEKIVKALNCDQTSSTADCLRTKSAEAIVQAIPGQSPVASDTGLLYGYSVDGFVVPGPPLERLAIEASPQVPLVIGNTLAETAFYTPLVLTPFDYQLQVLSWFGQEIGTEVLSHYPVFDYASAFAALVALTTDARWICPTRQVARAAAGENRPVFRYSFEHAIGDSTFHAWGPFHGIDLPFVFNTFSALFPGYTPSQAEIDLAGLIGHSWFRFASNGDPSGNNFTWPRYSASADPYVALDTPTSTKNGLRSGPCDFWDELEARHPEIRRR